MSKVTISRDEISITSELNNVLDKLGTDKIVVDLGDATQVSIRPLAWLMQEYNHTCGVSYKQCVKNIHSIEDGIVEIYGSVDVGTVGNCVFNFFYDFLDDTVLVKDRNGNIQRKKVSNKKWQREYNKFIELIERNKYMNIYKKRIT